MSVDLARRARFLRPARPHEAARRESTRGSRVQGPLSSERASEPLRQPCCARVHTQEIHLIYTPSPALPALLSLTLRSRCMFSVPNLRICHDSTTRVRRRPRTRRQNLRPRAPTRPRPQAAPATRNAPAPESNRLRRRSRPRASHPARRATRLGSPSVLRHLPRALPCSPLSLACTLVARPDPAASRTAM